LALAPSCVSKVHAEIVRASAARENGIQLFARRHQIDAVDDAESVGPWRGRQCVHDRGSHRATSERERARRLRRGKIGQEALQRDIRPAVEHKTDGPVLVDLNQQDNGLEEMRVAQTAIGDEQFASCECTDRAAALNRLSGRSDWGGRGRPRIRREHRVQPEDTDDKGREETRHQTRWHSGTTTFAN